jgi:hypothetical protein
MKQGAIWTDVCIRNMSSRGLNLQGHSPPPGTYIELRRGRHIIVARVVWSKEREFGAQAQDMLQIDAIVRNEAGAKATGILPGKTTQASTSPKSSAQAYQHSRQLSSTIQFGFVALVGLSLAAAAVTAVQNALANPMEVLASNL